MQVCQLAVQLEGVAGKVEGAELALREELQQLQVCCRREACQQILALHIRRHAGLSLPWEFPGNISQGWLTPGPAS